MAEPETILVYSTTWCPDCHRAKKFFGEQRVPYMNIDIEENAEGMAFVEKVNDGKHVIPTILFPDGSVLVEPTNAQLAEKLGLQTTAQRKFYDAIVIGSGPAGLTAALYLAREGVDTLVIEKSALGGQISASEKIDNFPGFDEGIGGAEFAARLGRQARRFGVEILQANEVTCLYDEGPYLCVLAGNSTEYACGALLLATGGRYRKLGVPGEAALIGRSVHFCATCDGPLYKDQRLLVVGGGNSGFEEGLYLARIARQVDIVEFLPQVKASRILQDQVAAQENMTVTTNHEILALRGGRKLEAVSVRDRATREVKAWPYDGVFIFIGLTPNSDLVKDKVELDPYGFVVTDKTLMTSTPGLFAAGDVRAGSTKQAASAAGEGVTAALMMREYLREHA